MEALRASVRRSFAPELAEIADGELREKVVEAWALALSQTEYPAIEAIPGSGGPGTPPLKRGTQTEHLRGVARMALGMADALEAVLGPLGIDRDVVLAGGLCHDLGKAYEFSPRNQARWQADPARAGFPAIRHPVYGVYLALTVGLPESVAHIAGAHSAEGERVQRSLENTLVSAADHAFWAAAARAGALAEPVGP